HCCAGLQIYQFYGTGISEEKKITKEIKEISLKDKKIYDITGKLVNKNKLKKGIYFKQTKKGIKKIIILR
ncbi:hypothetical protein, partial [Escherichia coli]|uniref:hypothetical protein n=1 Tax=Escherichia coli TaxID=562 RepID=UPI001386B6D5